MHELEWKHKNGFNAANDTVWISKITGKPLGELKSYKNFAFLRVFEAGHMVPYDQVIFYCLNVYSLNIQMNLSIGGSKKYE